MIIYIFLCEANQNQKGFFRTSVSHFKERVGDVSQDQ